MVLSCGIIGLPNVGKSTLFNALLSREIADTSPYPFCTVDPNVGVVEIPDPRLKKIQKAQKSTQSVPAVMEFVDIAGLVKGAHQGQGLGNQFLAHIREVNAVIHVIRMFKDPSVSHHGQLNPMADYKIVIEELIMADRQTLEKQSPPRPNDDKEEKLTWQTVQKAKAELENQTPLSQAGLSDKEKALLKPLCLLTLKPQLLVLNIDEDQISKQEVGQNVLPGIPSIQISAQLEWELFELDPAEQEEFLKTLDQEKSGLEQLVQESFDLLDLITFFTANQKESRSRTVKRGTTAKQAAGEVHSDMEEGFIKAVICPYQKFIESEGWKNALSQGVAQVKGKDYLVKDGDVVEFRFKN